jgi:hypothetical protein
MRIDAAYRESHRLPRRWRSREPLELRSMTNNGPMTYRDYKTRFDISSIADDTSLFSSSRINFFIVVDLILLIETEIGLQLNAMQVSPDSPDSVGRVQSFVGARRPEA